jgi:thiosulfate reductase cytochrome b subunit
MPTKTRSRWFALVWLVPAAIVLLALAVLAARWLRDLPAVASFIATYPGESALPADAPTGLPAWVGWQHFFNGFLLLLIVRTGLQVRRTTRPAAFWTRNNRGPIRTKRPPRRISLSLWFHLTLDSLWVLNGIVFIVLVFVTGHWVRLVPLHWDVFPNAVSVGLQYLSLDWPTENGWVNYNSLQLLAYFITIFIAAPLAILTGLRMSPAWPAEAARLNRVYPVAVARKLHFPLMLWFVAFTVVHVALVLATGALRNLNHMYASRDDTSWVGFGFFAASVVVMIAAWIAARPLLLRPLASLGGTVSR